MRLSSKSFWPILLLSALPALRLNAQSSPEDSLTSDLGYKVAVREYHAFVAPEVGLYRGTQYFDYRFPVQQGQPFLGPAGVRVGSVWYGGIEYDNIEMEYNLVKEQLVIFDAFHVFLISLYMDLVDSFKLDGHIYFRPRDSLAPSILRTGYSDWIHEGRFLLLKHDHKTLLNSVISLNNPQYTIEENVHYYILKNGVYYDVDSKRRLFHALSDRRRSAIRKVMKASGLEWSTDKEKLLLLVAAWYDGNRNH